MLYSFAGKSPRIDPSSFISDSAEIIGNVTIGPRCYVGPFAVIRGDAAEIILEDEVAVEDGVIIHAGGDCRICRRVTIGHGAIVHSRYLGPDVSIGMGAILSLNSVIGEGTVIGEAALVPQGKEIPAGVLVAGVPAKPLRELSERDIKTWQGTKDWYVRLTARYLDKDNYLPVPDTRSEAVE